MLTPQQLTHYHEQGFRDSGLSGCPTQPYSQSRTTLIGFWNATPEFRQSCAALFVYDTTFLNYARHSDILDMVAQILGEDIAIWNSSYFGKPAHDGKRVPWHQEWTATGPFDL